MVPLVALALVGLSATLLWQVWLDRRLTKRIERDKRESRQAWFDRLARERQERFEAAVKERIG